MVEIELKQSSISVKQVEELKKVLDNFFDSDFIVSFDKDLVKFKSD